MKIINEGKQLAYDLDPDTVLDMERTNPFFNEQGEQSLPVDLPATERNRNILGFADQIGSNRRAATRVNATILEGSFVVPGRQAVLSAQRRGKISTSFYINEGALYSKIEDVTLQQMFGDELIGSLSTVEECIAWCRTLLDGSNPNYCIFPALINGGVADDMQLYKWVNRYGYGGNRWLDSNTLQYRHDPWFDLIPEEGSEYTADFYNAVERDEMEGDIIITLPPGYYITPFIRGNYLLQRIFNYLGYTVKSNFFSTTEPFISMVFCNSCIDALANGSIKVADLVPECTISVILDIYRKKFNCEFIPNEISKTIDIVLFKDAIAEAPSYELTPFLMSIPNVEFPDYKQVQLSSDSAVSTNETPEEPESFPDMITKYPLTYYDLFSGYFCRTGYNKSWIVTQRVAPIAMKYFSGDSLDVEDIVVPDCMADMVTSFYSSRPILYIGNPIEKNSSITLTDGSTVESNESAKQEPILAFWYMDMHGIPKGTLTNYKYVDGGIEAEDILTRIWDYTLLYNGPDGIFEKFYRPLDEILRNSKHKVTAELNLPQNLQLSIPSHLPIALQGQSLFINNLRYKIGSRPETIESEFFTTKVHSPSNLAKAFDDYFPEASLFIWVSHMSFVSQSESQYNASPYKDRVIQVIYPPFADPLKYSFGVHHFEQTTCLHFQSDGIESFKLITYWLEIDYP